MDILVEKALTFTACLIEILKWGERDNHTATSYSECPQLCLAVQEECVCVGGWVFGGTGVAVGWLQLLLHYPQSTLVLHILSLIPQERTFDPSLEEPHKILLLFLICHSLHWDMEYNS